MGCRFTISILVFFQSANTLAQVSVYPYRQSFDSVLTPNLPPGWSSSQNRVPGTNDFTTSTSTPNSPPNAVLSTNATVEQSLISPLFDFSLLTPDSIAFFVRRSATHDAVVVLHASTNGGSAFVHQVGDSIRNPGTTSYVRRAFPLPTAVAGFDSVVFRWQSLANGTGSTGTLRFDDVMVTALVAHDLATQGMTFFPPFPTQLDSITARTVVRNQGTLVSTPSTVQLFLDADGDSIPEPAEMIGSSPVPGILPGDSLETQTAVGGLSVGDHRFIMNVVYPPDQNISNNRGFAALSVGHPARSLVVNEVMYAPTGTEPEWIELASTSADTVNLKGWYVSDNITTSRRLLSVSDLFVPPVGLIVVARDSAALLDVHPGIPVRVVNLPQFPTLNNTGDAVVLYDNRLLTMDSVEYTPAWGGSNGSSLERILPTASSTSQGNWGASTSTARSTPGRRNSISPKDHDLRLSGLLFTPSHPIATDSLTIVVTVKNTGLRSARLYDVSLYLDIDADSLAEPAELIQTLAATDSLASSDSTGFGFSVVPPVGLLGFIARVSYAADEDTGNNSAFRKVYSAPSGSPVRINEIQYSPTGTEPEWVEIINAGSDSLDLNAWLISDLSATAKRTIAAEHWVLPPDSFLVLTRDTAALFDIHPSTRTRAVQISGFPTLNNTDDAVVLYYPDSTIADSAYYLSSWGGNVGGTSLERIDPLGSTNQAANWGSSLDSSRSTPARQNSIGLLDYDAAIGGPTGVSALAGQPAVVPIMLRNAGILPISALTLMLYNDIDRDSLPSPGELLTLIPFPQVIPPRDSVATQYQWDSVAAGTHFLIGVVGYAADQRLSNNIAVIEVRIGYRVGTLVINEIMYEPLSDHAEYVEVHNNSGTPVDLVNWTLDDLSSNSFSLADRSVMLAPGAFHVIASDSSILRDFPNTPSSFSIVNQSSLGLSNTGDGVMLRDILSSAIDSVVYSPAWHNPDVASSSGKSLERINPRLTSNDPRNWSTSASQAGGTPGATNTIFSAFTPAGTKLSFSPNPFSPDGDGFEDAVIIQYELTQSVTTIRLRVYDVVGRLVRTLAHQEPSGAIGSIVWDGRDDDKQKVRIGMYVVLLEAFNSTAGEIESAKGVVVVAGKM